MKTIDALVAFRGRICGGSEYMWHCFGTAARWIDFVDADNLECGSIIHDTVTHEVYELTLHVPGQDQAFRWMNPDYTKAHMQEAAEREVDPTIAWDNTRWEEIDEATALKYAADISDTYYDNLPVPA